METFVLGAAHSGKSEWAIRRLAPQAKTTVIGTAVVQGLEARISGLKALRPQHWTHYEGGALAEALSSARDDASEQILVDSINLWLANFLLEAWPRYDRLQHEARIRHEFSEVCQRLDELASQGRRVLLVSSEVGAGVTPPDEISRVFRHAMGEINCRLAARAGEVIQLVAGLPNHLKRL